MRRAPFDIDDQSQIYTLYFLLKPEKMGNMKPKNAFGQSCASFFFRLPHFVNARQSRI